MLNNENLNALEAPFPIEDQKIRWDGNVYLTELPVIKRLTSVDLNWEFKITSTIVTNYSLTRPDCVTVSAELTICGITRAGVGSAIADVTTKDKQGKELTTPIIRALGEKELKGAATDALKRCARQFGVGAYILRTNKAKIRNIQDFANWYTREFGKPQPPPAPRQQSAPEPPPSELDGPKQSRNTDNVTPENVLVNASSWGPISRRLVTAELANHVDHAFNRLAKIVKSDLGKGNAINLVATAKWTEADVIAKFEARIAEKANES